MRRAGALAREEGAQAYLVGGAVRDVLLRVAPRDVDVVVEGDAPALARILARERRGRACVHGAFGTASVETPEGLRLDLATARTERYRRPGALPEVGPGDLHQDLFRRDFTVNALAARLDPARFGQVVDPFGGRRDLKDARIRVLHARSFLDDPTRALRAARLSARLGFTLDPGTRRLLRAALAEDPFARLSPARLSREIERLLSEPNPSRAVGVLMRLDLLRALHPDLRLSRKETGDLARLERLVAPEDRSWLPSLAILLSTLPPRSRSVAATRAVARGAARALAATGSERADALLARMEGEDAGSDLAVHDAVRGEPREVVLVALARARSARVRHRLLRYLQVLRGVRPDITGRDLLRLGIPQGPRIAAGLRAALAAKLDARADRQAQIRAALLAAGAPRLS